MLNLAEGARRRTRTDQARFFQIAFGSLRESQAILDLAMDEGAVAAEKADVLAAHVYRLIKCCRGGWKPLEVSSESDADADAEIGYQNTEAVSGLPTVARCPTYFIISSLNIGNPTEACSRYFPLSS